MVKNLALSLFLVLTACAEMEAAKPLPQPTIDYAFLPYLEYYKADKLDYLGTSEVKKIHIVFWSMQQNGHDGMCHYAGDYRLIQIDPAAWFTGSNDDKMALFYHEMGHCDLSIFQHSDENTIMNPYGVTGWYFAANREVLLYNLFLEGK